jgi:hypothetical protein
MGIFCAVCVVINLPLLSKRARVKCRLPDIALAPPGGKAQNMSDSPSEAPMDRFVTRENIKRYRKLASEATNAAERSRIMELVAEEETKFKLEQRRGSGASGSRPDGNGATGIRVEHDHEEERGGGR